MILIGTSKKPMLWDFTRVLTRAETRCSTAALIPGIPCRKLSRFPSSVPRKPTRRGWSRSRGASRFEGGDMEFPWVEGGFFALPGLCGWPRLSLFMRKGFGQTLHTGLAWSDRVTGIYLMALLRFHLFLWFSYPPSRILTSFINGTVEGLDKENSFETIFISAAYDGPYEYTRVEDAQRVCKARKPDVVHANIDVLKGNSLVGDGDCFRGKLRYFELELNSGCNGSNCSPFNVSDPRLMPSSIFVNNLYCSAEGKMHGFFMFQSQSWNFNEMTLIGEGQWDAEKGQLCVVACRVGDGGRIVS
uniref:TSA: Wollemia nobilis Ref_Wollemi_Transcript_14908_3298 transcribed RNA sequence n=1 Tax=Wollemia nobilis TaxID=56998 RepID=A0A0C9RJ93_9CONI